MQDDNYEDFDDAEDEFPKVHTNLDIDQDMSRSVWTFGHFL